MKSKWLRRGTLLASVLFAPSALAEDEREPAAGVEVLPQGARDEVARRFPNARIRSVGVREEEGVGPAYQFEVSDGLRAHHLAFDEGGRLVGEREPARVSDVPGVVRRALSRQLGRASIWRADRVRAVDGDAWLLAFARGDRHGEALVADDGRLVRVTLAAADEV